MTAVALLLSTEAILWCAAVFISVAGYGALLLRLFGLQRSSIALAATSGLAVVIFFGGCLNLAHAVTPAILIVLTSLGIVAAVFLLIGKAEHAAGSPLLPSPSRLVTLLLSMAALLFAIRLAATIHNGEYQAGDDFNFYLAAPAKMLQLHHFAADPFSERRIMSSLGGNFFLQDLVLAVLPLANVQMADRALGLILLAFLTFALARQLRLSNPQQALFAVLVIFTPQVQFNLTFVLLPSALFFGLVYLAANRKLIEERPALLAILLGAVTGAVASMKSTYLPHGVVFIACIALFQGRRRGFASGAKILFFGALGTLLVIAPWMIASHSASGTFFYPSLGAGYHYSAYHLYPAPSGAGLSVIVRKVVPFCIPLAFLFLLEWFLGDRDEQGEAILALTAAAFFASLLVGIATGGDSVRRYNYPCILPAILLLYVVFSRRANAVPGTGFLKARLWVVLQTGSALLIVIAAVSIWGNGLSNEFLQIPQGLNAALTDRPIVPPSLPAEYAAMQRALPHDGDALATVGNSFLLDFRAHHIDIADFPGAASLPPGWPSRQDAAALGQYLLEHHLRYLIYNYADFAGFDEGAPHVIADRSRTQWIHSEARITLRSHQQYAELARIRRRLYDDGCMYILDLATPAASQNPPDDPNHCLTDSPSRH